MADLDPSRNGAPPDRTLRKFGLGILVLAAAAAVLKFTGAGDLAAQWLEQIEGFGAAGMGIFAAIYIGAALLLVPGSALTLAAGAIYGVVRGSILVSAASTIAAGAAFLIARRLARGRIEERIAQRRKFKALDNAVRREGWKIVLLTRLSPVFPYTFLNYAFGLSRVRFWSYILASWIGMMPGTIAYVYLGAVAGAAADRGERTALEWTLLGVGLAATIAVTVFITRMARRALRNRLAAPEAASH